MAGRGPGRASEGGNGTAVEPGTFTPPKPERDARGEPSVRAALRRVRSMLPTSPLPWHWHARINRGVLAAILLLAAGGAVASVLIQRAANDDDDAAVATPAVKTSPQVRKALGALSLSQKVEAVTVAGFADLAAAEAAARKAELGGVIVTGEDWASGGSAAIGRVREAGAAGGRIAPLVVAVQEGGAYRAYPDLPPDAREIEIGSVADPALAERSAMDAAESLKAAGFDLNLAPVADVATIDSPIADRAYGDDPVLVSALVAAAVRGCRKGGIGCAVTHFPGLGGASADTATGPATVSLDSGSLRARDLAPFEAAFEAGAPATVLSLAFYAAYDPVTPAALSPSIATDLLRDELGFEGAAISDDLSSGAIAGGIGAPEAAVQALAAGTDMVLISDPAEASAARAAILQAAESGAISQARLDEAAARVLTLKQRLGLLGPAAK